VEITRDVFEATPENAEDHRELRPDQEAERQEEIERLRKEQETEMLLDECGIPQKHV